MEDQNMRTPEKRLQLPNAFQVDDRGSVHAGEATRIEPVIERGHRFAKHVYLAAAVQLHVIVSGLDPIDFIASHKHYSAG
jgi:hypothetical protein